jgi:hypothetical protein
MKVAAASTTIPVTNAAMQEYAKISLRTLAIVTPRAASPIRAATLRPLQHRGEKVKFFELEPLNARKNSGYAATRQANSGIRKKPAAAVARETLFRRRKIAPSHPNKRQMDMNLVAAAPLGLGLLIALGRHLSDDVLSFRMTSDQRHIDDELPKVA